VAPLAWGEPLPEPPSGPALHTAAVGFDPYHWRSVVFALWTEPVAAEPGGQRYDVLHLSTPELDGLHV
jgi:hypothetical protein